MPNLYIAVERRPGKTDIPEEFFLPIGWPASDPSFVDGLWLMRFEETQVSKAVWSCFWEWTKAEDGEDGNDSGVWADFLRDNPDHMPDDHLRELLITFLDSRFLKGAS